MNVGQPGTVERYRRAREVHQHVSKRIRAKVKRTIRHKFLQIYSHLPKHEAMRLYRVEWHQYPA